MKTTLNTLAYELACAEKIIQTMLKHMTVAGKCAAAVEIEDAGVAGEGMTRFHERRAALALAASTSTAEPWTLQPLLQAYVTKTGPQPSKY